MARENPKAVYGPALSQDMQPQADRMLAFLKQKWLMEVPHFGADHKDSLATNGDGGLSFHPLVIEGHLYVMEIGHAIGPREHAFPDLGLVLFDWRDGDLVPVASAEVKVTRGALTSLEVKPN